jgi:hypothetical protein
MDLPDTQKGCYNKNKKGRVQHGEGDLHIQGRLTRSFILLHLDFLLFL